jgi:protein TonB
MPDSPRKPESSRAFETHADDSKPTGFRRYINILAITVPLVVGLVLILIIVHSLNEPVKVPSPIASAEPSPSPTPSTPAPTPTANSSPTATAESTPPATTPTPKPTIASQKPTAPPVTQPPTTPAPSSIDQVVTLPAEEANAMRISSDPIQYPVLAKLRNVQGRVVVDAIISKAGTVENVHVLSGPPLLQDAALAEAKSMRYKPYFINGKPVRVHTQINVDFDLTMRSLPQ